MDSLISCDICILEGTPEGRLGCEISLFEQLKLLTDGSLIAAGPTFYKEADIKQLSPRVREALKSYVVPSCKTTKILPNFFIEIWPSCFHYRVGMRHSIYVGCMGARAMHVLQSYGKPDANFDGNAYTIVGTYDKECLRLYSLGIHPTKLAESGSPVQYHMTRLASFVIQSVETPRAAMTAYRNLVDWTNAMSSSQLQMKG
jgi:hypothetical protein